MALQSVVGNAPVRGTDGQRVVINQAVYTPDNYLSDGTAKPGKFAFAATSSDTSGGEAFGLAAIKGSKLLGFVERVADASIVNALANNADTYPLGAAITVAVRGAYYITAPGAVVDGQKVLVSGSTGAISIADDIESGDTDSIDTGWTARVPNGAGTAAQGDIVIIERY